MAFEQLLLQGNQWIERQEPRSAIPCFMQILQSDPRHVGAMTGLAKATLQLNDPTTAWQMLQTVLAVAAQDTDVLNTAGNVKLALGEIEEAIRHFEAALALCPDEPGILLNLATAVCGGGDLDRAEAIYQRLEAEGRATETSKFNHSLVQLLCGQFAKAWPGFELRGQAANTGLAGRTFPGQRWDGRESPGESLLVHAEQGLGDNIQFVRYLPQISRRVGHVVLEAPKALVDLFANLPGVDEIVVMGEALPDCTLHASIMSLPALSGTVEETIPADIPYLPVVSDAVATWRERLRGGDGRFHVGLVWAGNAGHRRDRERSLPLRTLAPALKMADGAVFHAFQIGEPLAQVHAAAGEFGLDINVLFPEPQPLTEVAAALSAVDLLISVDTGLAHLAGAIGRPVWNLITYVPDWRWMMGRADTPWYPTMRLFRQSAVGDWDAVVTDVGTALAMGAAGSD